MNEQLILTGESSLLQLNQFLLNRSYSSFHILTDTNTRRFCLPEFHNSVSILKDANVIEVQPGEGSKTLDECEFIIGKLLENSADRNALLINLGGGMITDLGGFTASIYKRGIDFVHVPTSLMGMVDASIGGKTAVNTTGVKNSVGSFKLPEAIFIYHPFLETLPLRELRSAFAEIIKHVLLSDVNKWKAMKEDPEKFFSEENIPALIEFSVRFKRAVVESDFHDTGKRQSLNFGHTLGHAIESTLMNSENELLHGEAVAAGMIGETFLSHKLCGLEKNVMHEIVGVIRTIFPELKTRLVTDDLMSLIKNDKKNKMNAVSVALLKSPGSYAGIFHPNAELISESIQFVIDSLVGKNQLVDDKN